jgi:peptidoglycan endopeptidase LytF
MSRRDTIIIAVLINAGLLIVLFATALKSGSNEVELAANSPSAEVTNISEIAFKKDPSQAAVGDEVDQALAAAAATPQAVPAPINFADDLKSIALPEKTSGMESQPTFLPPTAQPVAAAAPAGDVVEIKVKKGDVLDKIAKRHKTSVAEIMRLNNLSSSRLKIGQPLKIPGTSGKASEPRATSPTFAAPKVAEATAAAAKYYVVKNGDNPWSIAVKNHMKLEELLKLNNLNEERARQLKPGDQIRIR